MEYKHLGAFVIGLTWLGLLFVLHKWPAHKGLSFSQHIAPKKSSQIYYFFLFVLTLPLFYLFITKWFIPALELPITFEFFVTLAIAGQLVAVSIPETDGWKRVVHWLAAGVMSFMLIPLCAQIAFSSAASGLAKTVALVSLLYMIAVWLAMLSSKKFWNYFLYLQSSYVAMFHITILVSTYER